MSSSEQKGAFENQHSFVAGATVDGEPSVRHRCDEEQPPRRGYRQDSPPETIALLHAAQTGDTDSFADLYRLHVARVTNYVGARMRHRDRDAIPDIVQESFCEAYAGLDDAHHDVTGWLLAHAAKACIRHDWSTRRYVRASKTMEEEALRAGSVATAQPMTAPVGRLTVVHALARLADDQRRAVQLRFIDGLANWERAEELGRSLDAVRSLERRALRNLRVGLGRIALNVVQTPDELT